MDQGEPHIVANGVIAPELGNRDLVVFTQPTCDIHHGGRYIQVERGANAGIVRPLGQCLQMVDGLARLNLDDGFDAVSTLGRIEHQIGIDRCWARPDRYILFRTRIHAGVVSPSALSMQQTDNAVVLELFADGPH